jgi:hypothetical protein
MTLVRKLLAVTILIGALVLPTTPAKADPGGACSVTAILSHIFTESGAALRMNASTVCSGNHISATIEIFLHAGGRKGPVVFTDQATASGSAVEIQRFYSACDNGQKYTLEAFGWARADRHHLTHKWSSRHTCPDLTPV